MLLAYLDESKNGPYYWIAALICDQATMVKLRLALDEVVSNAAHTYGTEPTAELHGYSIFHGTEDWKSLKELPPDRIKIYTEAFHAIAANPEIQILIRGIDTQRQKGRYSNVYEAHAVVLGHVLERLGWIANNKSEYVLAIADQTKTDATYRQQLLDLQHDRVKGLTFKKLIRIVDTLHFVPSSSSRFIQAADLILYIYARKQYRKESDERAKIAIEKLWGIVEGKISTYSGLWTP